MDFDPVIKEIRSCYAMIDHVVLPDIMRVYINTHTHTDAEKMLEIYTNSDSKTKLEIIKYYIGMRNSVETLKFLCSDDSSIDFAADDNILLKIAAVRSSFDIVKFIIEKGVSVCASDNFAIKYGAKNPRMVKLLLENGADPRESDSLAICHASFTVGSWDSENNGVPVMKLLVENGVNIHTRNDWAFRYCAKRNDFFLMKFLIEQGANIRADENYALRHASTTNNFRIVKLLLENGADPNCLSVDDLYQIVQNMDYQTIKLLSDNGVDFSSINHYEISDEDNLKDAVKILIEKGVDATQIALIQLLKPFEH